MRSLFLLPALGLCFAAHAATPEIHARIDWRRAKPGEGAYTIRGKTQNIAFDLVPATIRPPDHQELHDEQAIEQAVKEGPRFRALLSLLHYIGPDENYYRLEGRLPDPRHKGEYAHLTVTVSSLDRLNAVDLDGAKLNRGDTEYMPVLHLER